MGRTARHAGGQTMEPNAVAATLREALGLHRAGRLAEARECYERVLRAAPRTAPALNGLGMIHQAQGRPREALPLLRAALAERPDSAIYHNNLANTLLALGRAEAAEAAYREAVRLDPDYENAQLNLGALLRGQGRIADAIACYERAVALAPDRAGTFNDLDALYQLEARVELALAAFDRALELDATLGEAHFNRGKLLADLGRFEEARDSLERAMALAPSLATESACHLAVAHRHLCDWEGEAERTADLVARIEALLREAPDRGLPPLTLNVVSIPGALRLAVARHLGRGLEREVSAGSPQRAFRQRPRRDGDRLRVGYLSPDFRQHAVGTLIHDLFRHHDRNAVSVHAYALVCVDDPFQRSVRAGVDRFVDVSRETSEATARRIHADGIDVLVDLAGYTTHSRTGVLARRPAPVQLHWLGYLDTMGAAFLPYLLADAHVIPEGEEAPFSETVVSLPRGFAVSSPLPIGETPSRRELGLPEDAFVFCCMNGLHKLDAATFAVWMRILARVPDAVLWLADEGSPTARANLGREARARGVDPDRLHFAPRAALRDYLARYRAADLFLDTFAYNAGATGVGALRAGLPVLTKPGDSFMSRMGGSLCTAAGIPDLVCADAGAYEERAVALATDRAALADVRARLARSAKDAPLFDVAGFARQLEAAYRAVVRHRAEGSKARRIRVEG